MSLVNSVDRAATVAWCPSEKHRSLLASGTIAGTIDDSFQTNSILEIFDADLSEGDKVLKRVGGITVKDSFHKVAWGMKGFADQSLALPSGLIAGGMSDGCVNFWNPHAIIHGEHDALISRSEAHKGAVLALEFHPKEPNLFASGATDGEVLIWDIANPRSVKISKLPPRPQAVQAGINFIAWNKKVPSILASSNDIGETIIWDLRQKRAVLSFRVDGQQVKATGLAWNPTAPVQLAVCYTNATPEVWDLRQTMAPKHRLAHGHQANVQTVAWNPHDANILVTTGQDNNMITWNPNTGELLDRNRSDAPIFDFQWSPHMVSLASTSRIDGKVDIRSFHNAGRYVPQWLGRPCGSCFSFGGKLVSFSLPQETATSTDSTADASTNPPAATSAPKHSVLTISQLVTEPAIVERSEILQRTLEQRNFAAFCEAKIQEATTEDEKTIWQFMCVFFEENSRQKQLLLKQLGYEPPQAKKDDVDEAKNSTSVDSSTAKPIVSSQSSNNLQISEDEFFEKCLIDNVDSTLSQEDSAVTTETKNEVEPESEDDQAIRRALVVSDFATAVDICLNKNRMADALVLSSCGDAELWNKTRSAFFQAHQQPFIKNVVSSIVKRDLDQVVNTCDVKNWKETMALLITYTANDTYRNLATKLAQRLEEAGMTTAATLVYMCCGQVEQYVATWTKALPSLQSLKRSTPGAPSKVMVLQDAIEKIAVFAQATHLGRNNAANAAVQAKFCEYATLLASQGQLATALKYLQAVDANHPDIVTLKYRLYYALPPMLQQTMKPPQAPFHSMAVVAAPAPQKDNRAPPNVGRQLAPNNMGMNPNPAVKLPAPVRSDLPPNRTSLSSPPVGRFPGANNLPPPPANNNFPPNNTASSLPPPRNPPNMMPPPNMPPPNMPPPNMPPPNMMPSTNMPPPNMMPSTNIPPANMPPPRNPPLTNMPPSNVPPPNMPPPNMPPPNMPPANMPPPRNLPPTNMPPPHMPPPNVMPSTNAMPLARNTPPPPSTANPPNWTAPNLPSPANLANNNTPNLTNPNVPPPRANPLPLTRPGVSPMPYGAPNMPPPNTTSPSMPTPPLATLSTPNMPPPPRANFANVPTANAMTPTATNSASPSVLPPPRVLAPTPMPAIHATNSAAVVNGTSAQPPKENAPVNLSGEAKDIKDVLEQAVERASASATKPVDKKKVEDVRKKLPNLYNRLNDNQVAPAAVQLLTQLSQHIARNDVDAATNLQTKLVADHWNGNDVWIGAIKNLLSVLKAH